MPSTTSGNVLLGIYFFIWCLFLLVRPNTYRPVYKKITYTTNSLGFFLNCYAHCFARCCWYACAHLPLRHTKNGLRNNKATMIKKGYIFVILFALFIAVSRTFIYWYLIKKDFSETNLCRILLQALILFLIFLIPGLLPVLWYYKIKDK